MIFLLLLNDEVSKIHEKKFFLNCIGIDNISDNDACKSVFADKLCKYLSGLNNHKHTLFVQVCHFYIFMEAVNGTKPVSF